MIETLYIFEAVALILASGIFGTIIGIFLSYLIGIIALSILLNLLSSIIFFIH